MALTLEGLNYIADHHGKQFIEDTINDEGPLQMDQKILPHKPSKGVEQINVRPNSGKGGAIADGAQYAQNTTYEYTALYARRVPFAAQVKIPIAAAQQVHGSQAVADFVEEYFQLAVGPLAYALDNLIIDKTLATVTANATIASNAVTVSVDDVTRFREGMAYVWNDNGVRNPNIFTCTGIAANTDGVSGQVSFSTLATGTLTANQDTFEPYNTQQNASFVSLWEASGPKSSFIYTQTQPIDGWAGVRVNQSGTFTVGGVNKILSDLALQGKRPNAAIMNPKMLERYENVMSGSSFRRFTNDELDPLGKFHERPTVAGVPIHVNANAPAVKFVAFHNSKINLGVFKPFGPIYGQKKFVAEQTGYNFLITVDGQFQLLVRERRKVGALYGVTYN